jgi:deoxyhypusine monooxygenase
VRETCELAVARIEYLARNKVQKSSKFMSVDPAPAAKDGADLAALKRQLLDTELPLFERYRAMFALRDIGSEEAVLALALGLKDKSALFRHEVGYVFGQLQHPAAVTALMEALHRDGEHAMVRHEAAEALGSIATDEVFPVLKSFAGDKEVVVAQSCEVALDMYAFERSGAFQYADTLTKDK